MVPDDVRSDLIDEILGAHAGSWLVDAARAAETTGEAEAVLRYHLVGAMGGWHRRRWQGERAGVMLFSGGATDVIGWRELAELARQRLVA